MPTQDPKLISQNEHSTIMAYYEPSKTECRGYQSEAELESKFIKDLQPKAMNTSPSSKKLSY